MGTDVLEPRTAPPQQGPRPELEVDLRIVVRRFRSFVVKLWNARVWMSQVTAAGIVLGLALAFLVPKRYESTVRVMPPDSQSLSSTSLINAVAGLGMMGGAGGGLASTFLNAKTPGAMFIGILNSRTVQDDLINRFDLRRVYNRKLYVDTRKKLAGRTAIEEDRKSGIVTITVTDNDPRRARDIATAYVEELDRLVNELSTSTARRERIFLEGRLKAVNQDLDIASRQLSLFSSRNATMDVQAQGKAMVEAVARLQGELIAAQSEVRGVESIYTGNNSRVQAARARANELRRQLDKLGGSGPDGDSTELKAGQLYPSLRALPLLSVPYYDLYRKVKVQETVFEILTKQYELAKVQEAKELPTVKILDAANLPEKKSFPPRTIIIVIGGLLGFLVAASRVAGLHEWRELLS